ncbi:MAG: hypothetical protein JNL70_22585 [Saprospiraceae bacterium]|nr:hypothetical protein [Saprospiraceae bacterium]
MLEAIFEFFTYIIFDFVAKIIITPILELILKFFNIPIVDRLFSGLAKILAVVFVLLFIWVCLSLIF